MPTPSFVPAAQPHYIWLFPGIEGGPIYLAAIEKSLKAGNVEATWRHFDWQRLLGLDNLTDYAGNLMRARDAAARIAEDARSDPAAIVDLIGYSGGGGIVLLAIQELPPDVVVRHVVLAQPAISPDFDLSRVLDRVGGVLVNIYSPTDAFILGAGTRTFGTIDRRHVDSAGRFGFDEACSVPNPLQRTRLIQQPWTADMGRAGHNGDHIGMMSARWNTQFIAPWVR